MRTLLGSLDRRQVRLGVGAFAVVFSICLVAMKPHLLNAVYRNFATIHDYRFFENREVRTSESPEALPRASRSLADPGPATAGLLEDLKTTALLALEDGQIVYERYFLDGGPEVLSGSFSVAKSIVAILTGFALQEGRIRSLDEPVENYLTEWSGREEGRIRLRDLGTMTTGLDWNESYWNPFSITAEAYYGGNLLRTTLRQRSIHPSGSRFSYQSGATQLLGMAVARAVNQPLAEFASRRLWRPLRAEKNALWSLDQPGGMEKSYCCFNATARDFARIGELVRNRGAWKGAPLLDPGFIERMIAPHLLPDASGSLVDYYGFQWWILKTPEGEIPYARGILGQYILVIPQRGRVVVRLGKATAERVDHHPNEVRALAEWGLQK